MKKIIMFLLVLTSAAVYAENNPTGQTINTMACCPSPQFLLFDSIARDFSHYINYREGLIRQARFEDKVKSEDKAELARYKDEYVKQRNFYRGELQAHLLEAKFFFSSATQKLIDDFIAWDNTHITDTVDNKALPTLADYTAWQHKILQAIAAQLPNRV